MKQYLSNDELNLIHDYNHVIIANSENPEPTECETMPKNQLNSDYVLCGELECIDKNGHYGCCMKYSLIDYYVHKDNL